MQAACVIISTLLQKRSSNKTYNWAAEVGHPTTNQIFTATKVSTASKAGAIALGKCHDYVTENIYKKSSDQSNLSESGYSDCFVKRIYEMDKNDQKLITKKPKKKDSIKKLPESEYYFYALKDNKEYLLGYVNQDPNSKMIKVKNRKFRQGNKGKAFKFDGVECDVYSRVDENKTSNRTYTGNASVKCKDGNSFAGNWVQYGTKGSGIGIDVTNGENIEFYFTTSKNLAIADLNSLKNKNKNKKVVKKDNSKEKEEYKPKNLNEDNDAPKIKISKSIVVKQANYKISGEVEDQSDKIFIEVDGQTIIAKNGKFEVSRFSPINEKITITAVDKWGNQSDPIEVEIIVDNSTSIVAEKIEPLNPSKIRSKTNKNKVALIIGIEKYEQTPAATFANLDAKYFYEYARNSFGISKKNIKILVDEDANLIDSLGIINKWLPGKIKSDETELIIFFAGHGLASNDGEKLFLLPQDSDPDLLERTALSRNELFETILKLNPKKVTMFFDTCFSGISRDEKTLLASARPIRITADEQNDIPENFTIFSASQLDQISSGLSEVKHGIFSYYLMKGLEGKADTNNDRKITNGELLTYLDDNISQKASELGRQQNPSLAGDPNQILSTY